MQSSAESPICQILIYVSQYPGSLKLHVFLFLLFTNNELHLWLQV